MSGREVASRRGERREGKESGRESRGTSAWYGPPLGGLPVVQSALRTGVASLLLGDSSRPQPRADNRVADVARSMRERRVLRKRNDSKENVAGATESEGRQHHSKRSDIASSGWTWGQTKNCRLFVDAALPRVCLIKWFAYALSGEERRAKDTGFEEKEQRTQRGPERVLNSNRCACLKPHSQVFQLTKLCLRPWGKHRTLFASSCLLDSSILVPGFDNTSDNRCSNRYSDFHECSRFDDLFRRILTILFLSCSAIRRQIFAYSENHVGQSGEEWFKRYKNSVSSSTRHLQGTFWFNRAKRDVTGLNYGGSSTWHRINYRFRQSEHFFADCFVNWASLTNKPLILITRRKISYESRLRISSPAQSYSLERIFNTPFLLQSCSR